MRFSGGRRGAGARSGSPLRVAHWRAGAASGGRRLGAARRRRIGIRAPPGRRDRSEGRLDVVPAVLPVRLDAPGTDSRTAVSCGDHKRCAGSGSAAKRMFGAKCDGSSAAKCMEGAAFGFASASASAPGTTTRTAASPVSAPGTNSRTAASGFACSRAMRRQRFRRE